MTTSFVHPSRPAARFDPRTCLIALILLALAGRSSAAGPGSSKQWAVLIGVEKYHRANTLRHTVNDVRELSHTLQSRGGVAEERILRFTDEETNPRFQPLRASIVAELGKFLEKPGAGDQVLVYFSGHGFRDASDRLYLAPIDCDPQNPAATAISLDWFRERLVGCKAGVKLLVIDSCHAGSEKGGAEESNGVFAKDLAEPFRGVEGVVTLAGSTGDEKSQIWEEKRQSLFSYWLTQGLRGHCDGDGDGAVDIDELYNYVHRNVVRTAKLRFPRPQTPVRIVRSGTAGVPVVLRLRPQSLKEVIYDMASQLAWAMEERRLNKVGVLEFTNDTQIGELLGADFGLLGRYCASELEREMMTLGEGKFGVVDRRRLQSALKAGRFSLEQLGNPDALRKLADANEGMAAIALGTLRSRAGRVVTLQCRLMLTDGDELAGSTSGTALLNESEWAMLGRSVKVESADRRPPLADDGRTEEDRVVQKMDSRADAPHPLSDPTFPFRLRVKVGDKERPGTLQGNDWIVRLRKGEVYRLEVENNSGQVVMLRLLVDGLNTLPEPVSGEKAIATWQVAAPVNLGEARAWVLDPARSKLNTIAGFVTETGAQGKLLEFTVVDAASSLAARQEFTEQLGIITAAFYMPASASRTIGTAGGAEQSADLTERGGLQPGNLLAVVHIRYVDPDGE